jgi:hypothetical protein
MDSPPVTGLNPPAAPPAIGATPPPEPADVETPGSFVTWEVESVPGFFSEAHPINNDKEKSATIVRMSNTISARVLIVNP